jgi:hypothetical protein
MLVDIHRLNNLANINQFVFRLSSCCFGAREAAWSRHPHILLQQTSVYRADGCHCHYTGDLLAAVE